jgi:hypothetical protein
MYLYKKTNNSSMSCISSFSKFYSHLNKIHCKRSPAHTIKVKKNSRKQQSSATVVVLSTFFFFLLAPQSLSGRKTFQNNTIKNSSDKAQSLLHMVRQAHDTLCSQRCDTFCPTSMMQETQSKRHFLRFDSTFPAEGPKDGMTQPYKEMHFQLGTGGSGL